MRLITLIAFALLAATLASAQYQPASAQYPYDLDPYKPSDAALLRNYGATLVAQTPLLELRKLDPYIPSQAALMRQLGGAMAPWVGWYWPFFPPAPNPAPLTPFPRTELVIPTRPNVLVIIVSPNNGPSPLPRLQDRQREPNQLRRPEPLPVPHKNPGFRAARHGGSGPTLFLVQRVGAEDFDIRGVDAITPDDGSERKNDRPGPDLTDESEREGQATSDKSSVISRQSSSGNEQ